MRSWGPQQQDTRRCGCYSNKLREREELFAPRLVMFYVLLIFKKKRIEDSFLLLDFYRVLDDASTKQGKVTCTF